MADWGEKLKESDWEPAGIDLNDKDMMKLVFNDLGIAEDYRMQTKLRAFIIRLQQQQQPPGLLAQREQVPFPQHHVGGSAQRNSTSMGGTIPEHFVPVLLTLAVSTMKSGWEKISSEFTKSESSTARIDSVSFYGLQGRKTCQILGNNTTHVQNAHIWPHNNREGLVLVDLQPSDIDDPKNVLRLHDDIEHYFDRFHLTFVLSGEDFVLKVLDPGILNETLKDRSETFRDINGRKLQCPRGNLPWRRLLTTHSIFAHQKARDKNWLPEDQYTPAETNAYDLMEYSLDTEAQDRMKRFLNDVSTAGAD